MSGQLQASPAVGIINAATSTLTLSWQPPATDSNNSNAYPEYSFWQIIFSGPENFTVNTPAPANYTGGTISYTRILGSSSIPYSLSMIAFPQGGATQSNAWQTNGSNVSRSFPSPLTPFDVTFSSTSLLLGQTLTVTLNSVYTGADQWQVLWPDNTSTSWLPVAATSNIVTKSFSTPGTSNVTIQTRRAYTSAQYNPPVTLISQLIQQIYIVNQQSPNTSSSQNSLTGDLGIGGQQGFEIVSATSSTALEPWEVIARAIVRDTITNELKLLVATSRFSNASSLYGTMALDVFPLEGRPRQKDFILPPYELTVTSNTNVVPISITTSALPILYVGKSVTESLGGTFTVTAQGGTTPYIWSSAGLPEGLSLNASGVLSGTPLELGLFSVTLAVQDSSVPFFIAEQTYSLTIATDLEVIIAPNQTDANNTLLAQTGTTLGVAQVGTPYNVEVQVGNVDPNESGAGGLPPYTWSAPAGNFPIGLSITTQPNSLYGLISGIPATYSTTNFSETYAVTIQVTDSIGATATQTYTMSLKPEILSFGHLNQTTLYVNEKFKLVVPVFGGESPYTFNGTPGVNFLPDNVSLYGTVILVDGQIEVPFLGTSITGTHTFALQVTDSNANTTGLIQFTFTVETEISDIHVSSGYLVNWAHPQDGSWGYNDNSVAGQAVNQSLDILGNLGSLAISGTRLNLTAAANAVGPPNDLTTTYTMVSNPNYASFVGQTFLVSGFSPFTGSPPTESPNNGVFACQSSTATQLVLNNTLGVMQTAPTYTLNITGVSSISSGLYGVYAISGFNYGNGTNNALAGLTFVVTGFTGIYTNNNGTYVCSASTSTTVTLNNANAVVTGIPLSATATTTLAKALGAENVPNGITLQTLSNGITMAIDPTCVTVDGVPEVKWSGAPSSFNNAEVRVPIALGQIFNLTSVATSVSGNATYTLAVPISSALATVIGNSGSSVIVTGFATAANNNAVTPFDTSSNVNTFTIQSATTNTIVLNNSVAVSEANTSAILITSFIANLNTTSYEQISREYTTLAHNDPAPQSITSVIPNTPVTGQATYHGTVVGGGNDAFAKYAFTIYGFANGANNGYFTCISSTATSLVFSNSIAVHEVPISPATAQGDIGNIVTSTRPYIVGDVVGLNPRKPYYDSSNIPAFNSANAWTATVQNGSSLPPGLSLDSNTGLIYGVLGGTTNQSSVIQYIDVTGAIHGTVTINWVTLQNNFVLTDNENLDSLIVNTAYTGANVINAFTAPTPGSLISASVLTGTFGGALPLGLNVGIDLTQTYIVVSGTPTEAGYFDCWFQTQTNNNQTAYAYHRVSTIIPSAVLAITGWADIISSLGPPVILGPTQPFPLPNAIVSANYVDPINGYTITLDTRNPATGLFTGDPPYTFSSSPTLPNANVGTSISLSQIAVSGYATAGMLSGGPVTAFSPNDPVSISFSVVDSASNTASITTTFASQATTLSITPTVIPTIIAGKPYAPLVTLTASEASPQPPYKFSISPFSVNQLPVGLTLTNVAPASATIQGTTIQTGYGTRTVIIRVTDNIGAYTDVPYSVAVIVDLILQSGIDYEDSLSLGLLGYVSTNGVENITVRPNLSFYIIATNVVSTSITGITVSTNNPNIAGAVQSLNTTTGVAQIEIFGSGFNVPPPSTDNANATYTVDITVIDSGVSATQTFTWIVYNDGLLVLSAQNAFPTRSTLVGANPE